MRPRKHIHALQNGGLLLSSLYVFLLGAASFCMFAHAGPAHGQQHHSPHQANHTTLCIWACQLAADSSATQITTQPEVRAILLAYSTVPLHSNVPVENRVSSSRSRAPPQFLFSI